MYVFSIHSMTGADPARGGGVVVGVLISPPPPLLGDPQTS